MRKEKQIKRSPLKARPLRNPGQSANEEILRLIDDELTPWLLVAMLFLIYSCMEWLFWYLNTPRHPLLFTILAVVIAIYVGRKILKSRKHLKALALGRDGEIAIGQYLERLREKGYKIFHDIQGDGFNIDHVIISPQGVFSIETKTISMPVGRKAIIRCQNGNVIVDGHPMDRNPIEQAKAQASWLGNLLESSTGQHHKVKPVVVFPGWFVEPMRGEEKSDVWVLNPKALPTFISNESAVIEMRDVSLISHHLSLHIQAKIPN